MTSSMWLYTGHTLRTVVTSPLLASWMSRSRAAGGYTGSTGASAAADPLADPAPGADAAPRAESDGSRFGTAAVGPLIAGAGFVSAADETPLAAPACRRMMRT